MNTKICCKCGIEKKLEEFVLWKGKYINPCRKCKNEYLKQYYLKNKEKASKVSKEYHKKHKEEIKEYAKKYREEHKEELKNKRKIYNKKNNEKLKNNKKEYYEKNKQRILKKSKQYYLEHKEEIIKREIDYFNNNRKNMINKANERNKKRRKNDNIYRLKCQVREMLKDSFKRKYKKKNKHTEEILGCSIDFFINYLLETFKNNYGYEYNGIEKVHIDHIIPLATANTEEEIIKLCYYTNLQLLKAKDNLKKSNKLEWELKQ